MADITELLGQPFLIDRHGDRKSLRHDYVEATVVEAAHSQNIEVPQHRMKNQYEVVAREEGNIHLLGNENIKWQRRPKDLGYDVYSPQGAAVLIRDEKQKEYYLSCLEEAFS